MGNIEEITRAHFRDEAGLRPEAGFAASPAFDLRTSVSGRLRRAYEATMPALYFGVDPLPTWEEICRRVGDLRDQL